MVPKTRPGVDREMIRAATWMGAARLPSRFTGTRKVEVRIKKHSWILRGKLTFMQISEYGRSEGEGHHQFDTGQGYSLEGWDRSLDQFRNPPVNTGTSILPDPNAGSITITSGTAAPNLDGDVILYGGTSMSTAVCK